MNCNKCGCDIGNASVCPECGAVQNAQPVKSFSMSGGGTPEKKKKKSKKWAIIAVLCSLISIILSLSEPEPPEAPVGNTRYTNPVYFPEYNFDDLTENTSTTTGSLGDSVPSVPSSPDSDITRTIMVYMVGSDLESNYSAATYDLMEMVDAQFDTSEINVVVCAGGKYSVFKRQQ